MTVGRAHYFLSTSHLSTKLQNAPGSNTSTYNIATVIAGPPSLRPEVTAIATDIFSFQADIDDTWTQDYAQRTRTLFDPLSQPIPPFSPDTRPDEDEDGDVEFPLTPSLSSFLAAFSRSNPGPVTMFNLISVHEGMFPSYQRYMDEFREVLGPKYGPQPRLVGPLIRDSDAEEEVPWEMVGWIWYPGAANFGRMLEDEEYKKLDRMYKKGVVRDNPIVLVVELEE